MFILHIDGKNIDEEENHHPNLFTWGSNEHCTFATEEIKPSEPIKKVCTITELQN